MYIYVAYNEWKLTFDDWQTKPLKWIKKFNENLFKRKLINSHGFIVKQA